MQSNTYYTETKSNTTNTVPIKILYVEDDPNLSMILQDYLEMIGYQVDHARDGVEGIQYFKRHSYNLLLLDIMMPRKDGFSMAEDVRKINDKIPIIYLTAKNLKQDRIHGFRTGCDDYITKPFSTEELSLRIKAILRRCETIKSREEKPEEEIFMIGKFEFDSSRMTLTSDEGTVTLTRKESSLLKLLCLNINGLMPRELALSTVWGDTDYFIGRSMDVFITKLRKHLKSDKNVKITNVHGIGFKLEVFVPKT